MQPGASGAEGREGGRNKDNGLYGLQTLLRALRFLVVGISIHLQAVQICFAADAALLLLFLSRLGNSNSPQDNTRSSAAEDQHER